MAHTQNAPYITITYILLKRDRLKLKLSFSIQYYLNPAPEYSERKKDAVDIKISMSVIYFSLNTQGLE